MRVDQPPAAEVPAGDASACPRAFGPALVDPLIVMSIWAATGFSGLLRWELGLFLAFLVVAWRAPAGGLWRRVGFAWLHLALVVLGLSAVLGLAKCYADAPDIIWFSLQTVWRHGLVKTGAVLLAASAVGACAGGLVAWMLRKRWPAPARADDLPYPTPAAWDRLIMLGMFVLASALCVLVGWQHEDALVALLLSAGFLTIAWRAPEGALWRRVWSAWAATTLGTVLVFLAACMLVHLDPQCHRSSGYYVWVLAPVLIAFNFATVAGLGGSLAWLIRRWRPARA